MVGFIRGSGSNGSAGTGGVDTSDATATIADILSGKTAYANGEKITGTIPEKYATTILPGTTDIILPSGLYLAGAQTIQGDSALVSSNIKKGTSIFGVSGSNNVVDTSISSNAITAANVVSGKKGFANGSEITGNMTDKSGTTQSASASTGSSRLTLSIPTAGYYSTTSKLYASYSTIASLLGISASRIVEGYTICGVSGTHQCNSMMSKQTSVSGSNSKTISCSFTPCAVAWLLVEQPDAGSYYPGVVQARIGGYCHIDYDGYLTTVNVSEGAANAGLTFTKSLTAGDDVVFYSSSVSLNNVMTSGLYYEVIIMGEE